MKKIGDKFILEFRNVFKNVVFMDEVEELVG